MKSLSAFKTLLIFAFTFLPSLGIATEISGVVELSKEVKNLDTTKGALFVFAKKPTSGATAQPTPPVAVLRIPNPKFPINFTLTEKNVMMPGTPFAGPLTISARFSPSGDALDKSGPQGTDEKNKEAQVGNQKIKIELKK